MLPTFFRQSVVVIKPGSKTVRNQTVPDWENSTQMTVSNCSMQPASTTLSQDGRVLGIADRFTCYMPSGTSVKAGDRIAYDNKIYTIDGDPREWPSASGRLDHIELNLVRYRG